MFLCDEKTLINFTVLDIIKHIIRQFGWDNAEKYNYFIEYILVLYDSSL